MNHIIVKRLEETVGLDGYLVQTTGTLTLLDKVSGNVLYECKTLEKGWRGNKKHISCIPPAPNETATFEWETMQHSNAIPYPHIWIKNVPNRTGIKIHVANRFDQLEGCIAVGKTFIYLEGDDVIDLGASRIAMNELMSKLTSPNGTIQIDSVVSQTKRSLKAIVADIVRQPASNESQAFSV